MNARAELDDERRRAAITQSRFTTADVEQLDLEGVEDLAAGREIDDAMAAGETLGDIARSIGHTDSVSADLLSKFRAFRDGLANRGQIALF
ncbi:urea amidohydrolase [Rhodococcus sp. RS1C4]|nr:urea amidohydrolase [Rhodococcus sp. RS1C4]OZC46664.1 urea amidohydrolase [Rhodococcus sp. RS1C4]